MGEKFTCVAWAAAAVLVAACTYVPPPAILSSDPPAGGVVEDPASGIFVTFTKAIKRESLEVALYLNKRDEAGDLLPRCAEGQAEECLTPVAGPCSPQGNCPGAALILSEDFTRIAFKPGGGLAIGEYDLRISAGLEDLDGHATGVPLDLTFFIKPAPRQGVTTFRPGVFLTWLDLTDPFDFPMEVYWYMNVDETSGHTWGGACDGDAKNPDTVVREDYVADDWYPAPYLSPDIKDSGFKFVFDASVQDQVVQDRDGNAVDGWYFETQPNLYIYCQQPEVEVVNGWMSFAIWRDEALDRDVVWGTMNSETATILTPPPQPVTGTVYGYRLREDEIGDSTPWQVCASTDESTVTRKPE